MIQSIGEILESIFGKEALMEAREANRVIEEWGAIVNVAFRMHRRGRPPSQTIANVQAHTRAISIYDKILRVETDGSGWTQLVNLQKRNLLAALAKAFPNIPIQDIKPLSKYGSNKNNPRWRQ
jgi:predicted nucleic acid-binding Zn ribbon protein